MKKHKDCYVKKTEKQIKVYGAYKLKKDWVDTSGEVYKKGSLIKKVSEDSWQISGKSSWLGSPFVLNGNWCEPTEPEKPLKIKILKTNDLLDLNAGDVFEAWLKDVGYGKKGAFVLVRLRYFPSNKTGGKFIFFSMFDNSLFLSCDLLINAGYAEYV
ncbi:MAG: hypothetical protein A4E27_00310 [Methanobacterium sp. PtaU1.Bin242]|jgi:hypothetical protein|nr:MAG: hypothetical protein A4E27_00310 [Methanobacterium sp. PtaU1.Bin242]